MSTLKTSVSYFNEKHKQEFKSYPNSSEIDGLIGESILISKEEFLTYLIFVEQKNCPGFKYYNELKNKVPSRIKYFEDYITLNKESIVAKFIGSDNRITENIGVSLSLCIMNNLHNLHEADWEFIPEKRGRGGNPTMDFKIASDGNRFIQVESKGSTSKDNRKNSGLSSQEESIAKKKNYLWDQEKKLKIKKNQNLAYGVIGVLDNRKDSIAKCWLLDPVASEFEMEPRKYRLLARLQFYWENLRGISRRSTLLTALSNRIDTIYNLKNYEDLNKQPLLSSNGEKIQIHSSSFNAKSVVKGGNISFQTGNNDEVIGKIYKMPNTNRVFYIGFLKDVFEMLIEQDFERILKFTKPSQIVDEDFLVRISSNQVKEFELPKQYLEKKRNDNYFEFIEQGRLVYSKSGRAFGIVNINENNAQNKG